MRSSEYVLLQALEELREDIRKAEDRLKLPESQSELQDDIKLIKDLKHNVTEICHDIKLIKTFNKNN